MSATSTLVFIALLPSSVQSWSRLYRNWLTAERRCGALHDSHADAGHLQSMPSNLR